MLCTNHECSVYVYIYAQSFNLLKIKFNILLFNNAFGRNKFLILYQTVVFYRMIFSSSCICQQIVDITNNKRFTLQKLVKPKVVVKLIGQEVQKLTRMEMDQENSQPGSIEMQKCSICKDFVPRIDIRYVSALTDQT